MTEQFKDKRVLRKIKREPGLVTNDRKTQPEDVIVSEPTRGKLLEDSKGMSSADLNLRAEDIDHLTRMVFWENVGTLCSRRDESSVISPEAKLQRTIEGLRRQDAQIAQTSEIELQAEIDMFLGEKGIHLDTDA